MMSLKKLSASVFAFLVITAISSTAFADVMRESTTKLDFKGALGTMMKLMGGEKPIESADYYKGDLHKSDTFDKKGKVAQSTIIDLNRELFININHDKKKYSQMTFDEWKEMLAAKMAEAEKGAETEEQPSDDEQKPEVKWSFKVDIDKPGKTETIAGKQTEQVIVKINVEAESKQQATETQPEQTSRGGLIVTSTNWMAQSLAGDEEVAAFNKKMIEKLGMQPGQGGMAEVINSLMQNNEQLGAAMKKIQDESEKLEGVALRTNTAYETWGEPGEEVKKEDEQAETEVPTSVGGLLKGFGKKAVKSDKKEEKKSNVLLETSTEVTKFETSSLSADLFEIPANYKEEKPDK